MQVLTNDGMDGFFSVTGNSTIAEDNSAPFLGVVSATNDIIGLRFFADIGNPLFPQAGNVAINQLDVRFAPESVSEPGSASLLATAALILLCMIGLKTRETGRTGYKPSLHTASALDGAQAQQGISPTTHDIEAALPFLFTS